MDGIISQKAAKYHSESQACGEITISVRYASIFRGLSTTRSIIPISVALNEI
jgi:hypothetical protein